MYNAVKPGYSKTAQALIRRGYVNHKYAEMSGDLDAYNQARNYYVLAQNKLQEKKWQGGLTADERRTLDILKQRIADINHKVADPGFIPGEDSD